MFHFYDFEGDKLTISRDPEKNSFFFVASDKHDTVVLVFDVDKIDGIIDALQHVKAKMEGGE